MPLAKISQGRIILTRCHLDSVFKKKTLFAGTNIPCHDNAVADVGNLCRPPQSILLGNLCAPFTAARSL